MNPIRKRRILNWLNVTLMTLLMAAFLVGVNLVAHSRFARIDMTTDKVWEISAQSRQILRSVPRDVEIYVNAITDNPMDQQDKTLPEAWRRTVLLLGEMASQNPRIKVAPIIEGSQSQAKIMAQVGRPEGNMIYFIYRTADDKAVSRALSIRELYLGSPSGEVSDYFGESRIITTISQLISDRKTRIYCTEGHREIPPGVTERRGLSVVTGRLTALENAEFKPLNLIRDKAVPDDADLVFIANPVTDFTTVETDALTKYWARGGRLFVTCQPPIRDPLDEFRKFLESCGIRVNRDIVIDSKRELQDQVQLVVRGFTPHPVNQGMPGAWLRIPFSCSVDPAVINKRMQAIALFMSSPDTWAETDLPPGPGTKHNPGERWGNIPLAAAAEEAIVAGRPSRIIVWGSAVAMTNELNLVQDAPNPLTVGYFLNNFRWLMEREVSIVTPEESRKTRMKPFSPPPGADAVIGWISLAGIPFLGIALGALALYFRRK
ncbi:MAG TPA: Gldg family protein [Planctomycetota bacterium]|nr:Gldg family protein [Planctomycetota bacterium]